MGPSQFQEGTITISGRDHHDFRKGPSQFQDGTITISGWDHHNFRKGPSQISISLHHEFQDDIITNIKMTLSQISR
uniref:Uncharacterized protein n=1 Tax=Octopus bimaculoides TaxID=37653 RepID=A0A0L8GYT1_OCTBM